MTSSQPGFLRPSGIVAIAIAIAIATAAAWCVATSADATPLCAGTMAVPTLPPGPTAVLVIGEVHGTEQSPRWTANTLCALAATRRDVNLFLEIDRPAAAAIERYLGSRGTDDDLAALLADPHWHPEGLVDGRTSVSMVRLIETARALRAEGHVIRAYAVEPDSSDYPGSPREPAAFTPFVQAGFKDAFMALQVHAVASAYPQSANLFLVGDHHATRGTTPAPSFVDVLERLQPRTVSTAHLALSRGTGWDCIGPRDAITCGVQPSGSDGRGFDQVVDGGASLASPPVTSLSLQAVRARIAR